MAKRSMKQNYPWDKNGKQIYCVACGEQLCDRDHHCDPKKEAMIEERRGHFEFGRQESRMFGSRLHEAYNMIHGE